MGAASVLSGAYYYVIRQQRRSKVCTDAEAVYQYIQAQFKKGFSEERIKKDLYRLDWKKDLSHESLEEESKKGSIQDQGALVLRFSLGLIFFYQGLFVKIIQGIQDVPISSSTIAATSHTTAIMIGLFQLVFGLLLLAGLWTRFVAALCALYLTQVTMMVTITGSPATDTILLLTISLTLVILGGGDASADRYVGLP